MINEERWHLDKRVPVALVITIVIQTLGFVWFGAQLALRVTVIEDRQHKAELALESLTDSRATAGERLAVVEESTRTIKELLRNMDSKLSNLVKR